MGVIMNRLSIVIICFFLFGCVSKTVKPISEFASATEASGEVTESIINEYKDISKNTALLDIADNGFAITNKKENGVFDYINKSNTELQGDSIKSSGIYIANDALTFYAKSLSKLSSAGSIEDVQESSAKVYSSLTKLNDGYKKLKNSEADIIKNDDAKKIAEAISVTSAIYIDTAKHKALKLTITSANNAIHLLGREISKYYATSGIKDEIKLFRRERLSSEINDYDSQRLKLTRAERFDALSKINNQKINYSNTDKQFYNAAENINNIVKAHQELSDLVNDKSVNEQNIHSLIEQIKNYVSNYKEMNKSLDK
jgi:hypothetical protein